MSDSTLDFPAGHRCFEGHFPGDPVVPAATVLSELIGRVERRIGKVVIGVANARFSAVLRPDTPLSISIEPDPATDDVIRVSGRVGEKLVVRASFLVAEG